MTAPTQDRPRVRPAIDPRIRERRIEVIREAGRRRLRVTLVIASAIVVIGMVYLVIQSPLLDVDRITVTGTHRETAAEIVHAAGVHRGDALLFVDTGAVARRIDRLHWVEDAKVKRDLPGTLDVTVTEYVATSYIRMSPRFVALVASTGRVIGLAHVAPARGIELIGERGTPEVGSTIAVPGAADIVRQLPARLGAQVRAVDVSGPSVTLDLATAPEQVRLGSLDNLGDKGAAALAVLDHLAGQPFSYIDVAAPQAPVSR